MLVSLVLSQAGAQDCLDIIAEKTCECLQDLPDTLDTDQFNLRLGLCMLEAAMPFEKQLRKEYGINLEMIDVEGERLGRIIGLRLATNCPEGLELITRMNSDEPETEDPVIGSVMGEVLAIDDQAFVVFSIKEQTGRISKYFWLTLITADDQLIYTYPSLVGRTVNISFEQKEFFDPRIAEYRTFNIIRDLVLMEEL